MSGRKLFYTRLIKEWAYQWEVIRTILDWSIMLYIAIPAIIIAPFLYIDFWQYIELYWYKGIPFPVLLIGIHLLFLSGNFRTYQMEADLLHLIQQKNILSKLKIHAFLFSLIYLSLGTAFVFILLLPVLVLMYDFSSTDVVLLYLALLAFRVIYLTLKKLMNGTLDKVIFLSLNLIASMLFILSFQPIIYGLGSMFLIIIVIFYHLSQLTKNNRLFFKEIEIESTERIRYVQLLLHFSMEVEKEKHSSKKRPLILFRGSKKIFSERTEENGVLEVLLKGFLRNRSLVTLYCQQTLLTTSAIILLPIWLKWVIFICFVFFINYWLKNMYRKLMAHSFFHVVPFNKDLKQPVWKRFRKWILFPAISITGGVSLIFTLSLL
jgi:ABC-2 type transport system permease protein